MKRGGKIEASEPIKCTVRRTVTSKLEQCSSLPPTKRNQQKAAATTRVVRIRVTDWDATDSSGSDSKQSRRIVKKHVNEIRIERNCVSSTRRRPKKQSKTRGGSNSSQDEEGKKKKRQMNSNNRHVTGGNIRKYIGVRQRPCGKWAAEIRDPSLKARRWLGTYATAEEAAIVYDKQAIRIRGPRAQTNILKPPPDKLLLLRPPRFDSALCSPTSVLENNTAAASSNDGVNRVGLANNEHKKEEEEDGEERKKGESSLFYSDDHHSRTFDDLCREFFDFPGQYPFSDQIPCLEEEESFLLGDFDAIISPNCDINIDLDLELSNWPDVVNDR